MRITRLLATTALLSLAVLTACDDGDRRGSRSDPLAPAAGTVRDSLARSGVAWSEAFPDPAAAPARSAGAAGIVLAAEGGFRIEVVDTECAARGNRISLTSPVSQVLTTDGCRLSADRTWSFPGPFAAGTTVTFSFYSGYTNSPGQIRISGSAPTWLVEFEDGFDDDFNDIRLRVVADAGSCDFLDEPTDDPNLQSDAVLRAFQELWDESDPDADDVQDQVEMGGYVVKRDGELSVVPYGSNRDPSMCSSTFDPGEIPPGATLQGIVHTHPHEPGTPVPTDGSCNGNTTPGMVFGNGPSPADLDAARTSPVPLYVVDGDEVHRVPPFYDNPIFSEDEPIEQLGRNLDAACR